MVSTRRDFGRMALAGMPLAQAVAAINSKFKGVQIGAITYSFGQTPVNQIIPALADIGLGEVELMSNHCEGLAGAPPMPSFGRGRGPGGPPPAATAVPAQPPAAGQPGGAQGGPPPGGGRRGGRMPLTPEQQEEMKKAQEALAKWRTDATANTWKAVRKQFNDAGIEVAVLCYNMNDNMKDSDIEYGFQMAKGLGVKAISTSTTLTMAKRIAPIADEHKLLVGYHGHDATNDPNQTATLESYATLMAYGKYNGINLDIGHFTAAGYDAVPFIREHHDKITNLHLKDRKKNHGPNTPWGEGDTPIKDVLLLLEKEKYKFPANIELEYAVPEGSDRVKEMKKCLDYCKQILT